MHSDFSARILFSGPSPAASHTFAADPGLAAGPTFAAGRSLAAGPRLAAGPTFAARLTLFACHEAHSLQQHHVDVHA